MADDGRFVPALGRDWLTGLYDPVLRLTTRERTFKQRLLDQAAITGEMDVLDLGCGTGTLTVQAAQRAPGARLTGLDADPKVLERARAKAARVGSDVRLDQGFSDELPYEDESFDLVLSSLFFHHLARADKERTIREVWRCLRPGGELHVADWGVPRTASARLLSLSIRLLDGFENTRDNFEGRLPRLFAQGGFERVTVPGELSTIYGTLSFYRAEK